MRWGHRVALAISLTCVGVVPVGCKKGDGASRRPGLDLPQPLPLPDDPLAVAHVEAPTELLGLIDPWIDLDFSARATLARELKRFTTPQLAAAIADAVDPAQTWDAVRIGAEEEIAYVSIRPDQLAALTAALDALPSEGKFGARVLPRDEETSSAPVHLVWLDSANNKLAVAQSLRGLATGPELARKYGDQPVVLGVDASLLPEALPITRAAAKGTLSVLDIDVFTDASFDVGEQLESTQGALTGLMRDEQIIGAASSRWSNHGAFVKDVIGEVGDQVDAQPFLVRGLFQDMAKRFNAMLRSWNGRWAAGVGQGGRVYVAFGSDDPKKSGVATLRLLQSVVDNVKLARNFTREVPKVSLKKNAGEAAGEPIHAFYFARASQYAPDLRPVLDDKGRLSVAFAFSRHAGAGMIVVGPDPIPALRSWLIASSKSASGDESLEDLGAATLAVTPEQLQALRAQANPEAVLNLQANGPRRDLTVRQIADQHYRIRFEERSNPSMAGAETVPAPRKKL